MIYIVLGLIAGVVRPWTYFLTRWESFNTPTAPQALKAREYDASVVSRIVVYP